MTRSFSATVSCRPASPCALEKMDTTHTRMFHARQRSGVSQRGAEGARPERAQRVEGFKPDAGVLLPAQSSPTSGTNVRLFADDGGTAAAAASQRQHDDQEQQDDGDDADCDPDGIAIPDNSPATIADVDVDPAVGNLEGVDRRTL